VDISTREGTEKSRERGGAEAAMQVGDKLSVRERVESEEGRLWGLGYRRDCENHKSDAGDLVPVRKGRVEEAESKTETEVGVKMAKL
jgi:hypothetical protein